MGLKAEGEEGELFLYQLGERGGGETGKNPVQEIAVLFSEDAHHLVDHYGDGTAHTVVKFVWVACAPT